MLHLKGAYFAPLQLWIMRYMVHYTNHRYSLESSSEGKWARFPLHAWKVFIFLVFFLFHLIMSTRAFLKKFFFLWIYACAETFDFIITQFCRTLSSTNFQASDIRPLPTLKKTLHYLFNLLDDSEFSFDVVHDFLFDRTRAIRQELDMQRIVNSQAINMYEQIVCYFTNPSSWISLLLFSWEI
jgi:hypothetical protein